MEIIEDSTGLNQSLKMMNDIAEDSSKLPYFVAIKYFELGCEYEKIKREVTKKVACESVGIPILRLNMSHRLAKHFGFDKKKFDITYYEEQPTSFHGFYCKVVKGRKSSKEANTKGKLKNLLHLYTRGLKDNPADAEIRSYMIFMRNHLMRKIPPTDDLFDTTFLTYYDCCSCGAEATEGGHRIIREFDETNQTICIPICEVCYEEDSDIDWRRVASMYCNYSKNTEYGYHNLSKYV